MTTEDQDKNITLVALLGGIWPQNPFMVEIARRTPTTLRKFLDRADIFFNVEDTFEALMAPPRSEMEQANWKIVGQTESHGCEGGKRGALDTKKKREATTRSCCGPHAHLNLEVEGD